MPEASALEPSGATDIDVEHGLRGLHGTHNVAVAQRLIDQQQTILQSIFMVLVGYLWGNSAGNKSKDNALYAQAEATRAVAQTSAPTPSIPVAPGETLTVEGREQ